MNHTNQRHAVEWEGDEMLLPDMFDDLQHEQSEEFFLYPAQVNIDGVVKPGHIAYHFSDRQIWIQHTDTLHTVVVNLATAGRKYRSLYDDYLKQRARFRRLNKQRQKLKGRVI